MNSSSSPRRSLALVPSTDPFEVHTFSSADGFAVQGRYADLEEARETAALLTTVVGGDVEVAKVFDSRAGNFSAALLEFVRAGCEPRSGGGGAA